VRPELDGYPVKAREILMGIAKLCGFIILAAVVGCATKPAKTANAAGPDRQCHTDVLTGSMIDKTVCTTQAERDAAKANVDSMRQQVQTATGSNSGLR
jgi:hypothetical protein